MGTGLKFLSKEEVIMKQGTILGSQMGRWIILAALVVVLGALLLTIRPAGAQSSPPDAPTGLRAVVVNSTTVELYWTAPTNTGGAKITDYKIQGSANGRTSWDDANATALTNGNTGSDKGYVSLDGQTAGTAVHFRVRAINASGDGAPSNVVKAIPTPTDGHPAAPGEFVVEENGPAEINLAWTAPTGDGTGGADIAGYMIEYTEMENDTPLPILPWMELMTTTNDDTKYSNTGLSPVTKRWYRVSAINADDERSPASTPMSAETTPAGVPAAPTGFKVVVAATDEIEFYWAAPTNTGGGPIIDYRIETLGVANAWTAVGDAADENDDTYRVDDTDLAAGMKRSYRVSARNNIEKGLVSTTVTVESPGAAHPGQPTGLTAVAQSMTRINLQWTKVAGMRYVVEYAEKAGTDDNPSGTRVGALPWKELTTTSSNTASHTGLNPETSRWYRVAAINSKGRSLASDVASATTASSTATPSVPGAPTGLRAVVVNDTTVELYWTAPTNDGGAEITAYKIQESDDGNTGWDDSDAAGLNAGNTPDDKAYFGVADLTAGTAVHFRVWAINTSGGGAPSNVVKATPTPGGTAHPAAPANFVVRNCDMTWPPIPPGSLPTALTAGRVFAVPI